MICAKQFSLEVTLQCDHIEDATWGITIVDPNPGTTFSFAGGDGTYLFTLTGAPSQQGAWYRATSSALMCAFDYDVTCEIDYAIDLTDVGGGSDSTCNWQVRRNGVLIINQTKTAPNAGNLTENGTFASGPFTMLANTNYTFQVDITPLAIGVGTSSDVSGVFRLRPLAPP